MAVIELTPCKQCGTRYQKRRHWQLFCTDICKQKWHNEQREKILRAAKLLGLNSDHHTWEQYTQKER